MESFLVSSLESIGLTTTMEAQVCVIYSFCVCCCHDVAPQSRTQLQGGLSDCEQNKYLSFISSETSGTFYRKKIMFETNT